MTEQEDMRLSEELRYLRLDTWNCYQEREAASLLISLVAKAEALEAQTAEILSLRKQLKNLDNVRAGIIDYVQKIRQLRDENDTLRKQLATKDELIQSQRGLIEDVCKREAEAQKRVAELERGAECAECAEPAKYCTSCARRE